jgi:hypothetical protein
VLAGAMAERLRVALWAEGVPADAATGSAVPLVVRLLRTGDVAR